MNWINLGASKDAPAGFDMARRQYPEAKVITTNAGIRLCRPDYYWLSEIKAAEEYHEQIANARAVGTKLICPTVLPGVWRDYGLDKPDYEYTSSQSVDCIYSGLRCVQFAILSGCNRMLLPGHQGYISNFPDAANGGDYWYADCPQSSHAWERTMRFLAPWWQRCVLEHPAVEFVFYGALNFPIEGPNVLKVNLN